MRTALILFALLSAYVAQSATRNELFSRVDTWLTNTVITPFIINQEIRRSTGRRQFWQGVSTHTEAVIPRHTNVTDDDRQPNNTTRTPSGETTTWNQFLGVELPSSMPCSLESHVYGGADGQGWELVVSMYHQGQRFVRVIQFGPETYRVRGWHLQPLIP